MHKEFEIIDNEVIVRNNNTPTETRELTYNIKKILICENNIEEIESEINKKYENIEHIKKDRNFNMFKFGSPLLCMLYAINSILSFGSKNWFPGACWSLCFLLNSIKPTSEFFKTKQKILFNKKSIEYLNTELEKEKIKLKELKKDKNDDFSSSPFKEEDKIINRSDEIKKLQINLRIIEDYSKNKYTYINLYKKGILKDSIILYQKVNFIFYTEETFEFLEQLILLDNPNIKVKEKKDKVKTLQKTS